MMVRDGADNCGNSGSILVDNRTKSGGNALPSRCGLLVNTCTVPGSFACNPLPSIALFKPAYGMWRSRAGGAPSESYEYEADVVVVESPLAFFFLRRRGFFFPLAGFFCCFFFRLRRPRPLALADSLVVSVAAAFFFLRRRPFPLLARALALARPLSLPFPRPFRPPAWPDLPRGRFLPCGVSVYSY